jgi:hypothetical protein
MTAPLLLAAVTRPLDSAQLDLDPEFSLGSGLSQPLAHLDHPALMDANSAVFRLCVHASCSGQPVAVTVAVACVHANRATGHLERRPEANDIW